MITWTLAFLAGIFIALNLPTLPQFIWPIALTTMVFILWCCKTHWRRYSRLFLACSLGFTWLVLQASWQLHWQLPKVLEGKNCIAIGTIATIPEITPDHLRFVLALRTLQCGETSLKGPTQIRLSWYGQQLPTLHVGDVWQLQVRLKQPHGLINPGGSNYETWLFQHHIRATGYIVNAEHNQLLSQLPMQHFIDRLREDIGQRLQHLLHGQVLGGMVSALTIGVQTGITQPQWQVLRQTGTSHLMAISGLHISLVAGLVYLLVGFLWRYSGRYALVIATPRIAAIAGLSAAFFYSAMAGFSVPTQRALVMLSVFMGAQILQRHIAPWHALFLALFIVLCLDPTAILSASCWLSFGAVSLLIYGLSQRLHPKGLWWKWGRAQWVASIGMIPLGLFYFQQTSLISPLANMIAIPWVSFTVVPLSLIGAVCTLISSTLAAPILWLAVKCLTGIWFILEKLASIPGAAWQQSLGATWIFFSGLFGVALLLAPRGYPGRWLGLIGLLPLAFTMEPKPVAGEVWLTVLDVGQGLASVVRTQHHTLVFDTGPAVGGMDAGASVLVPYLKYSGIKKVDTLVISHGDNDHRGGAPALLASLPVVHIDEGELLHLSSIEQSCQAGVQWQWDGVDFAFLYPPANLHSTIRNDQSCVLKVTTGQQAFLLTGDIEKPAETLLVQTYGSELHANVLVAPHHGSRTSSSPAFLAAVAPEFVVYPTGYRNRYRFPSTSVVARYDALGARGYNTADTGAITFKINKLSGVTGPRLEREVLHKFWMIGP